MILKGEVDTIIFENAESGYKVILMDVDGEPVTVTGNFPSVVEGQTLEIEGEFSLHKKYGKQFKTTRVSIKKANTIDGIVRYLGSGLIKGIGPKLALNIVNTFGDKTFDIIEYAPLKLATVKGISKQKALDISNCYVAIKEMQETIMSLQEYQISLSTAMRIYKVYGKDTLSVVTTNPYRLIEDIDGIGFLTADMIAQKIGIEKNSEYRINAGIIHTLKEKVSKEGNTCYPQLETIIEASRLLFVDDSKVESQVERLLLERRVLRTEIDGTTFLVLPWVHKCEKHIAVLLGKLISNADRTNFDIVSDLEHYEKINGIELHKSQKDAVTTALSSGVALITGGPGTGKTTIIKCILDILLKVQKEVLLMAPTGRAAKRMSEATNHDAKTIHRACGFGASENFDASDKLQADVIIVDEFSMVDIFLFEALLKKIPLGARLILVGDKDQLPSVGAGNVLSDIMRSNAIENVQLTHIYRQAQESLIVTNAHAVNRGKMPELNDKSRDFFYVKAVDTERIAQLTVDMVERTAKYLGITPDRVQVLCPMKNGVAGAININRILQQRLNPPKASEEKVESEDYVYRCGDKVMHTVNNYDLEWKIAEGYTYREGKGVYNGDIGIVEEVIPSQITVRFEDGRQVQYTPDIYNQLVLAYAITVHKSQGSEFDVVVLPITGGGPMIMTRNLLYTAITRAKKMVVMVGEENKIKRMVDNDYIATRYSQLKEFIIEYGEDERLLFGN